MRWIPGCSVHERHPRHRLSRRHAERERQRLANRSGAERRSTTCCPVSARSAAVRLAAAAVFAKVTPVIRQPEAAEQEP